MSYVTRGFVPARDSFTTIDNRWIRDARLSRRARGLLTELLSHTAHYKVSVSSLVKQGLEGRDAVQASLHELEEFGYLRRDRIHDDQRRYKSMHYVLRDPWVELEEVPDTENPSMALTCENTETPCTDSPCVAEPQVAEPLHKKNIYQKNILPSGGEEDQKNTRRKDLAGEETPKTSNFQHRVSDDETSSPSGESAPALGSDPSARQENLRKAAASGVTGGGLAERLKRGLEPQGMHVTASAVKRTLNADFALQHGPSRELQREMVDLFIRNHEHYTPNDKIAPWQRFLSQRDSIAVDAKAILAARARDTRYSDYDPEDDAAYFAESDARRALQIKKAEQS